MSDITYYNKPIARIVRTKNEASSESLTLGEGISENEEELTEEQKYELLKSEFGKPEIYKYLKSNLLNQYGFFLDVYNERVMRILSVITFVQKDLGKYENAYLKWATEENKKIKEEKDKLEEEQKETKKENIVIVEEEIGLSIDKLKQNIDYLFIVHNSEKVIEILADYLMNKYSFKSVAGTKADKIYIYEDGIYKANGKEIIRKECEEILKEKASSHRANELINKIATRNFIDKEDLENSDENLICLNNGILDITTSQLIPHDKEKIFLTKIPVDYNPTAKCPKIEQFIKEIFYEDDISTVWEWIGFQLHKRYFIKKAVIHVGERDTGKSTILKLLSKFIGDKNISGVSLHKIIKSDFARKSLFHKHSNICDDLGASDIEDTGSFKMATGGGIMGAEEKFGDDFVFINYAKLTFACNIIPQTKDVDDDAYYSRFMVFRHDNIIENKDNFLIDKLTTKEELSGMLNLALEELKRLLEVGDFSYKKSPSEVKAIMQRSGNPLMSFVQDCLNEQENEWISKQGLFDAYIDYVVKKNLPRMTKDKFGKNITRFCRYMIDSKKGNERGWRNIMVRGVEYDKKGSLAYF